MRNIDIKIMQIFMGVDLRSGEVGLEALLNKEYDYSFADLRERQVFVFWNKKRNLVKVASADGILVQRLKGEKRRWDPAVDRDELFVMVGKAFGFKWNVSKRVYESVQEGG